MPTLGYWKIRGLAQPIRLLLTYAGEDFEDLTYEQGDAPDYSREAWTSVKSKQPLDFPNLPYYIDGDVKITQSNAILKHIARKHNLDGETVKDKAEVDMLLDVAMDFRNGTVRLVYNKDFENLKEEYFTRIQPQLQSYEKKLGDNPWFAGSKVTVADFPFYELLDQHKRMKDDILDDYPKLKAFLKRFEALPKVSKYLEKEEVRTLPINNKIAGFKIIPLDKDKNTIENIWEKQKKLVTVADFPFYELLDQHKRMKDDILDDYPKLKAFLKRFEALPKVSKYLEKEEVRTLPINNKIAGFK